jgi:hypothetical protein
MSQPEKSREGVEVVWLTRSGCPQSGQVVAILLPAAA